MSPIHKAHHIRCWNSPEDLDAAILDRCDESLFFPLPDAMCRDMLLKHYFDVNIRRNDKDKNNVKEPNIYQKIKGYFNKKDFLITIDKNVMDERQRKRISDATDRFSGREIAKLIIAIQGAAYASEKGIVTSKMIDDIVKIKVADHKEKREMCGTIPQDTDGGNLQY